MHQKARLLTRPRQVNISKKVIWTLELWAKQETKYLQHAGKTAFFLLQFFLHFSLELETFVENYFQGLQTWAQKIPPQKKGSTTSFTQNLNKKKLGALSDCFT